MLSKSVGIFAGMCLMATVAGGAHAAYAQDAQQGPPKVLVVQLEEIKPGKTGAIHQKSENAFVQAMKNANSKDYYLAMTSMTGNSRAAFLFGYPSFEEWEKMDNETNNSPLGAAIDRASLADGELLTDYLSAAYRLREDLSHGAAVNIGQMRYFDVGRFKIRPGHEAEWDEAVKMWTDAMGKLDPDMHWAAYQSMLGRENGGVYLIFTPMKSLSTLDRIFGNLDKMPKDDSAKRLGELLAASEESGQHNLFKFSPAMSYPSPEWVKADPSFWQPK